MARVQPLISKKTLMKFEGLEGLIGRFHEVLDNASGAKGSALKGVYIDAAGVVARQIRTNVQQLDASEKLKQVLGATIIVNAGPENKANALVGMVQNAAIRKLGKGRSIPNPAWFEYGTVARVNEKGSNRGMIHPSPVFRPALVQSTGQVTKVLSDGLRRVLLS